MIMAWSELILSESEWKSLLSIKEYAKQLFDVDISRNDGFQTNEDAVYDSGFLLPTPEQGFDNKSKDSSFVANGNRNINFDGNLPPNKSRANTTIIHGDIVLRPPPVIARIETKSSPENLEKCKKLAVAFTPSNQHFKVITLHVENQHYFEMVNACSASIQQSTAALIKPCLEKFDFTIQGHYSCVEAASGQVNMILHDLKSKSLEEIERNEIQSNLSVDCFTPSFEGNNNIPTSDKRLKNHDFWPEQRLSPKTTKTTTIDSNFCTDDRVYSDHSYGNAYNFLPLSNALREETKKLANSTTNQHHQQCENNFYESPCDSEEDNILTDDQFKRHIDQASKLGFCDKQIAKVLRRLGANSSIDDMMRELVQQPQGIDDNSNSLSSLPESVDNDITTLKSKEEDDEDSKEFDANDSRNLRYIVIDGSNVAMSHGHKVFSCMGIKIVVDWFKKRGHKNITVFVPQWRKEASRPDAPISNQDILTELEQERIIVFTPARRVGGTRIVCYDDRYVLQLAAERNGIVVSNDVYRDLVRERDDFREVVDKRLLMYSFVNDTFMPPEDPLGRQGPSLDNFLRIEPLQPKHKPQNCPYGKKCTYGNKCRYYHPERRNAPQKMVAEQLKENAEMKLKSAKSSELNIEKGRRPKPKLARTVSLLPQDPLSSQVLSGDIEDNFKKPPLQHSKSSSYLTGSRLKMEQAESKEVIQALKPTSQYNQMTNFKTKVVPEDAKEIKKYLSNSCTVSPRTSPIPSNEPVKNKLKEVKSFPSSPVPKLTPSAASMQSSLNIPNPEPQGRYLSGHLLVAKRLSDEENNSGNFFSQHTSRTPGSSQQETNKRPLSPDNNSSIALAPETISHQKQNEDTQVSGPWDSNEIFLPPEIPFQASYQPTSQEDRTLASTTPFYLSKDESTSNSESFNSCPVFTPKDEVFQMPQHQNFQRSLSTHTPFRSFEYQPARNVADRKYSLNNYMSPQYSAPSYYHVPQSQPNATIPIQSYQRNKSFDSGISSGLSADQNSSIVSPTDIQYPPFNNPRNAVLSPPPNIALTMMQQDMLYRPGPVPYTPQGVGNPVYPTSGHPSVNPWPYSPLPNNRMSFSPHDRSFGDIHNSGSQINPTTSQLPFSSPTYSMHYSSREQFYTSYPPSFVSTESQYYQVPTQHNVGANNYSPRSQPKVFDEEAPIEPDDPRYAIYFHLSSVFGERLVRTFMNRNPDVTKQGDLLNLISSYKQDMGM